MMFQKEQPAYVAFRNIVSERTSSLILWIGAGLSQPAGLPSWKGLLQQLIDALALKISSFNPSEPGIDQLTAKLDAARTQPNPWTAFKILKSALGATTYRDTIRLALSKADTAEIPEAYKAVWGLRPSGILNLNLDRLATRAHADLYASKVLNEFSGKYSGEHAHLLRSPHQFLANLHGIVADEGSWVLTEDDFANLQANPAYRDLLAACLMTKTILFLGITADDVAVGGHLARLRENGIRADTHYWLTHRRDYVTDSWAEDVGIRLIRYDSHDNHQELFEFVEDVLHYLPKEELAPPVAPTNTPLQIAPLPSQDELIKESPEVIRSFLNRYAASLLAAATEEAYTDYDHFCKEYDQAIYRAWYVTDKAPNNNLLGFKITKLLSRGAFGTVYLANATGGEEVAIKVLHQDIRNDGEMLQSFRRGVRSMQILSQNGVQGMVPYREASEIPAFVVMDYVDGPNLSEAVHARMLTEWPTVLRVAVDLARTIRDAHFLRERVLHRDIRPANIMLKGYYRNATEWNVVVLDFDLSWHKNAAERSILKPSSVSGYLAPEQVNRRSNASTRSAAVDSFGLGMTLAFMRTGIEPTFAQHLHTGWRVHLEREMSKFPSVRWSSLSRRFARLIDHATKDNQADRWDVPQILGELERLKDAEANPNSVMSAELLAEELCQRSRMANVCEWSVDRLEGKIEPLKGMRATIRANESRRVVICRVEWMNTGSHERRRIRKWLPDACNRAIAAFSKAAWTPAPPLISGDSATVEAEISCSNLCYNLDRAADVVSSVIDELSFR